MLAHPNIASKHWIIRQYDHEVQGGSVIKPLIGPLQIGPAMRRWFGRSSAAIAASRWACGLAPQVLDPYDMAIAAIDEAIRNVVCRRGGSRSRSPFSIISAGPASMMN